MSDIKRINFYGGPGCGKSTVAAQVFSALKQEGAEVELVQEYVKDWTFIDRRPQSFDQVFLFANQLHREDLILRREETSLIVTDSPILLNAWYGVDGDVDEAMELVSISHHFESKFPSLHIWLDRSGVNYSNVARFQNYREATELDRRLKQFLGFMEEEGHIDSLYEKEAKDLEGILKLIRIHCMPSFKKG